MPRPRIDHPWIDESNAPLYLWSFPTGLSHADLQACCAAREAWAAVAEFPVAWVVDLQNITSVGALERKTFGEHLARFEAHDVAWNQGSGIVAHNPMLRGLVTAVFWLRAPKFPNQVFATRGEASAWARGRLAAASGLRRPSR